MVTVRVEPHPHATDEVTLRSETQMLAARIKATIGLTADVVAGPPGSIERSAGKARRVLDRRKM